MATGFSVFVNIGGKVNPSLNAAINATRSQINGLGASLAGVASKVNAPFAAVNRHLAETSKRMEKMQRHGRNATLGVTTPAAWFGVNMIKDAAEFAKAGNMVEALGEATKEQRNQLSALSQDLAKRYDAGGATSIMKSATELLKAGFTFEQARGALEQVLAASALAGDMTPADVGASLSKTITQFHMPMKTYEQSMQSATAVTDRMVYAAVSTVASMKDVAETLKYAGSIAATTGNSLDSVTAITMAFAKAGVLGSEAGVALRSAIVRLVKMPKGGMKALSRIGMNLDDYTQSRPVTADGVLTNLKGDGLDASAAKGQIAEILRNRQGKDQATLTGEISKAVQAAVGSSSAMDANQIAESVNDALAAAGSKVDITKFMTDLRAKFEAGIATTGDIAQILEARHISRYMALLKADIPALIREVMEKSDGYSQKQYKVANQGLPAHLLRLTAGFQQFRNTVVESVAEPLADIFDRISSGLEDIAKQSPALLRMGVAFTVAAAAAGPLLFALGALGRIGAFGLAALSTGVGLFVRPLGVAAAAATLGIAGLARGFIGLGVAAVAWVSRAVAAVAAMSMLRYSTIALAGISALGSGITAFATGGLAALASGLRGVGVAMWALVANPVGLTIAAIVAGLAALGLWIYNNWDGIKSFFSGFGSAFMAGLGPAGEAVGKVWDWLNKLLGPISATNEQWRSWGETLGGAVATGINAVINGISSLIGFFDTVIGKAVSFGNSLRSLWPFGGGGGAALPGPAPTPPIAGARALGGPVSFGKPYLVGERGPELFVPGMSGRVETNDTLRRLSSDGAAVTASAANYSSARSNSASISIQVTGDSDPAKIAREAEAAVYRAFARLEADQRGLLSD